MNWIQRVAASIAKDVIQQYAVSIAALLAILFSHRVGAIILRLTYYRVRTALLKHICYAFIVRRTHADSVTRFQGLLLTIYITLNGLGMVLRINSINGFMARTGMMASVNMIPLFFGGRTSVLADFLGISLNTYYLLHHWIGRVAILQGIVHGVLAIGTRGFSYNIFQISGVSSASALTLILFLSFSLVRRAAYEFFLKSHFLLGTFAITALLIHLRSKGWTRYLYPCIALGIWTLNTIIRLIRLIYYNSNAPGYKHIDQVIIHRYERRNKRFSPAVAVLVRLRRPFKVQPGQYFYVFFTDMGFRRRFQAHPFMVAWCDNPDSALELSFLVQPMNGLSLDLARYNYGRHVILDGPYGKDLKMKNYETVLIFAKGIGIAGVLGYVRNLVERRTHENLSYRRGLLTRKLDLIWVLEENSQIEWVLSWVKQIMDKDPEHVILQTHFYFPAESFIEGIPSSPHYQLFFQIEPPVEELIMRQVNRTPGRTLIAVCGNNFFTRPIQDTVRSLMSSAIDITFEEVEYRPKKMNEISKRANKQKDDEVELDEKNNEMELEEKDNEIGFNEKNSETELSEKARKPRLFV